MKAQQVHVKVRRNDWFRSAEAAMELAAAKEIRHFLRLAGLGHRDFKVGRKLRGHMQAAMRQHALDGRKYVEGYLIFHPKAA